MILSLIMALILVLGIVLMVLDLKIDKVNLNPNLCTVIIVVIIFSFAFLLMMGIVAFDSHINIDTELRTLRQEYDSCRVLMEQGTYNDSPFEIKMEFYQRVESYNNRVLLLQKRPTSKWTGCLYVDVYKDFEILPLPFSEIVRSSEVS